MFRLNKLTDYAIVIICEMFLSQENNQKYIMNAKDLSLKTGILLSIVMKIMKILNKGKLIGSKRGTDGGYFIYKKPEEMRILDIINAMEGRIQLTSCADKNHVCNLQANCVAKDGLIKVNNIIENSLKDLTIFDLIKMNKKANGRQ